MSKSSSWRPRMSDGTCNRYPIPWKHGRFTTTRGLPPSSATCHAWVVSNPPFPSALLNNNSPYSKIGEAEPLARQVPWCRRLRPQRVVEFLRDLPLNLPLQILACARHTYMDAQRSGAFPGPPIIAPILGVNGDCTSRHSMPEREWRISCAKSKTAAEGAV